MVCIVLLHVIMFGVKQSGKSILRILLKICYNTISSSFQFAIVEVVVTSIQDGFPNWIKKRLMCHEVLVLVICVVSFLCGLPNVTNVS